MEQLHGDNKLPSNNQLSNVKDSEKKRNRVDKDVEIRFKLVRREPKKPVETRFILASDQESKEHTDPRLVNTRLIANRRYDLFTGEDTMIKIRIFRSVVTGGVQTETRRHANMLLLLKANQQKQKVRGFDGSNEITIRLDRE